MPNAPTGLAATKASGSTATDGKISGVTDAMEYQKNGDTTWTAVGENQTEITGLTAGTYKVRYAGTTDKDASPAVTIQVGVKEDQTAPTGLTATKATSNTATDGKISGVTAAMEYQIDGATTWTAVGENKTEITGLTAGTYKVRYAGTADKKASDATSVEVGTKTDQTAPTGLTATKASSSTATDGKISGVTAAMEYQIDGATTWTAVGENKTEITGLTAGTYKVRYAGTADKNASDAISVEVGVKEDQTAPTGLTATKASSSTTTDSKISGVTDAMEYQKDGDTSWTAVGNGKTEITGLTAGTYKVRYAGTADKKASDAISVEVGVKEDQTAPTGLTATKVTSNTATDGKISGVTAAMEYQIDGATTWTAVGENKTEITGLTAGTYKVRYAGTADKNASPAATVQVGVKAEATVTKAPAAKTLTYSGQAQELVTAGEASGGTMQYALGTKDAATGTYSASIPTGTEAGTYYVWYKVTGDDNHKDTKALSVTSSILPVDRDNLNKLIGEAEDYLETIQEKYPDIAKDLEDAINEANGIAENPNVKAEEIAEQIRKLTETLEKAKKAVKDAEDQAAAKAVKDLIDVLPDADKVTIDDKEAIEVARKAYNALTEDQKKLISAETLKHLTDDEEALANLDVKAVISQINALPDADKVTINDKEAIEAARKAYDALTAEKKQLVPAEVLKKLTDDEAALAAAEASEADRAAADAVVKMINALPDADKVTTNDKEAIEAARKAYDALTDAQKKLVPADVLKKLTDDEAALAAAEASEADRAAADAVVKMINALPDADKVTINDKTAIEAARKAYDALTDAQKKLVPADVLKKLTDDEAALKGKSISYKTYEGEGGEYKHGSDGTLTFVFKRSENDSETFARFTGLKYDGRSLTRDKDYTAKAGSVIITLDHELLESMMVGNHILTAVFDDGEADAHFTVIANAEPTATPTATPTPTPTPKPVPKTGDNSNPALWLAMMILGILCIGGVVFRTVRKRG